MATDRLSQHHDDAEPAHAASPTARLLDELQLYGHRPYQDDPDPRPLPEAARPEGALADIFDALVSTLSETRLEPDLADLLWSQVNLFHRAVDRVQRELNANEDRQRRSQHEQDGSEIRSAELERLIAEGLTLIERRNAFELLRDHAAELFERHTGSAWRPRAGSIVNHRALTAAMIDSRDFIAAKRRAETEVLLPAGPRIAFAGGVDYNDHARIWAVLDRVHRKHADMVLLHGGSPRGAERIAARWADTRKVTESPFEKGSLMGEPL
jgi:hypothetical protein